MKQLKESWGQHSKMNPLIGRLQEANLDKIVETIYEMGYLEGLRRTKCEHCKEERDTIEQSILLSKVDELRKMVMKGEVTK